MKGGIVAGFRGVLFVVVLSAAGGCATTGGDPRDPLEGFNRGVYSFNQTMDKALFDPVSKGYQAITPEIVDKGVSNIFSNLNDISVVVNDILQFKLDQAFSDLIRLVYNSTAGLGGFFDVSAAIGLPKNDQDFGQTLAHWGMPAGPFLMVPFFGPTTLRDGSGFIVDRVALSPITYIDDDGIRAGLLALNYVDFKADLLSAKKLVGDAALDEYEFIKNAYFEKRASQISGETPMPDLFED